MRLIHFLAVFFICFSSYSQDYVRSGPLLTEGVYFDYDDYLNNTPGKIDLVKRGSDVFFWSDSLKKEVALDPGDVWGYSINNNVYVSYENGFWKLINKGKLNHFSAIVVSYYQTYDSFGMMINRESKVLTHLFFDIDDGRILLLNKENFNRYFEEDAMLEKYYRKLGGRQTEKLILVLQAYNERHPE